MGYGMMLDRRCFSYHVDIFKLAYSPELGNDLEFQIQCPRIRTSAAEVTYMLKFVTVFRAVANVSIK